jgi:WhiB family redox-sensing transcriptional regulator
VRHLILGIDPTEDVLDELREEAKWGDWGVDAICQQVDPDLWFPEAGGRPAAATAFCSKCPVMPECRADSLDRREQFGIWGGLSDRQRRRAWRSPGGIQRSLIDALVHVDDRIHTRTKHDEPSPEEHAA